MSAASVLVIRGTRGDRRARLLVASLADVARLEAAQAAGWDVAAELEQARRYVAAFEKSTGA